MSLSDENRALSERLKDTQTALKNAVNMGKDETAPHTVDDADIKPDTANGDATIQTSLIPDESSSKLLDLSKGLNQRELAERLGKSESGVLRAWKPERKPEQPEHFAQWSQQLDPDGLAWVRRKNEGIVKYFPIDG